MAAAAVAERHRFSVEDFHRMSEVGILPPKARIELLDGELLHMAPIGPRHAHTVNLLARALILALGDEAVVSIQNPVVLGDKSEPQPDIAVLAPGGDYAHQLPTPEEVLWLIEVTDSSAVLDRSRKLPLYARHGVREVWILDLTARVLEVYRQPETKGYGRKLEFRQDDSVAGGGLPEAKIALTTFLP